MAHDPNIPQMSEAPSPADPYRDVVERAARSIVGQLETDQLLTKIVDEAADMLGVEDGFINLLDHEARTMKLGYARGVFTQIAGMTMTADRGITGQVWREGRGAIVNNYMAWEHRVSEGVPVSAMIAVPLKHEKRMLGILALAHTDTGAAFTRQDMDRLGAFAELSSIAMANARLHAELHRSRQRYRSVVQDQTDMVGRFQPDGTITFANEACAAAYNLKPSQMVGRMIFEFIPESEHERTRRELAALTPESPLRENELRVDLPDGTVVWQQWHDRGIFDADGELVEVQTVGRDITAQKLAAQALAGSEARYRTLFNSTPSGLLVEDEHGVIVDVNDAVCRMLDYKREELIGQHVSILTDADRAVVDRNIDRVLSGETFRHSVTNLSRDGKEHIVELLETRIDLPDGQPGVLVVSQDITERQRGTEALRRSERRARDLADRTETLLNELDHRVKNNLVGLMTLVSMYARSKPSVEEMAEALTGKLHAMRTVHDRLSRRQWRSIELRELIGQLLEHGTESWASDRVRLKGPRVEVPASQAGPLAMVVQELVTNAYKHGALSHPQGSVAMAWKFDVLALRLTIDWREFCDNGATEQPKSSGQGMRLIEGLVGADLRGSATFTFHPDGLRCEIICKLESESRSQAN